MVFENTKLGLLLEKYHIKPQMFFLILGLLLTGLVIFLFSSNPSVLGNMILIVLVLTISPYFIFNYLEYRKIREMENMIPSFLRDIADSVRAGSTLPQAIKTASDVEYGRLTPEVRKLANQLSWGITFPRAVELFVKRTKKSKLITKSMRIMLEAYNAGGNIADAMEAVAESAIVLKESEKDRNTMMNEHVVMMYAIFFIFIGIVMALTGILLPILDVGGESSAQAVQGVGLQGGDPCEICTGLQCGICDTITGVSKGFGLGEGVEGYYKGLFFLMIIVQGIFSGLVTGQIGQGDLASGAKHSMIMAVSGFSLFLIVTQLGII